MIGVSILRAASGVLLVAAFAAILSGCPPVDPLVDVDFDASPIAGFAPLLVQFKADVTYRPSVTTPGRSPNEVTERPIVREYFWTFGDGSTGTGEVTTHLYRRAGAYGVTLTVLVEEQEVAENGAVTTQTYLVSEFKPVYVKVFGPSEQPPVANAGPAQTIQLGESATLDGRQSFDPDGDPLTFAWALTNAPQGSELNTGDLRNANTAQPGVTPDVAGAYTFTLTVSDGDETDSDTTTVVVEAPGNTAPIANAGPDQTVFLRTVVNLDGSGSSDADGQPLSFRWTILEAPQGSSAALGNANTANPQIQVDAFGQFIIQLIVNDGQTDSAPDTVVVTVVNRQPTAVAGNDQTVVVGQPTQLDGTGSSDPEDLPLSFSWTVTADVPPPSKGESFTLEGEDTATPTFTALVPGTYTATLVVNDGMIDRAPDSVTLSTDTNPPQIQYPTGDINGATINSECGTEFDEPTALDPEEGDVTDSITRTGEVDITTPGTYALTYIATDSSGNTSPAFTLTVNVVDSTPP
ncbi:MAG: PKD domain-containing protein, partial [Candidatus Hydrogenedentes bacterium]|nr:PKD domain-containing protein [Candidatus Hydrogenedentota bacterium]